jgi:hypothetical protein
MRGFDSISYLPRGCIEVVEFRRRSRGGGFVLFLGCTFVHGGSLQGGRAGRGGIGGEHSSQGRASCSVGRGGARTG